MKIKLKKINPAAKLPTYAKEGDAGIDFTATGVTATETYVAYKTGIAIEIPKGYVGLLFSRSSVSKKDLVMCNCVGVVDSGYRGEIEFRYKIVAHENREAYYNNVYNIGDRVGQLIVLPYPTIEFEEVDELSDSERGEGGFGHTNEIL